MTNDKKVLKVLELTKFMKLRISLLNRKRVLLLHDKSIRKLQNNQWEVSPYPPYGPYIFPCASRLF